jgi:hypothetical protein
VQVSGYNCLPYERRPAERAYFLPVQNPSAENFEIEINAILDGER